jgi:hypothetical protein
MVVQDFADNVWAQELPFQIIATDISRRVLGKGQKAIYEEDKVAPIPVEIKKRFLLKSKNPGAGLFRIVPRYAPASPSGASISWTATSVPGENRRHLLQKRDHLFR